MDKIYCKTCGMDFEGDDTVELEAHSQIAHEKDPLGLSSDADDVQDPNDDITFLQATGRR